MKRLTSLTLQFYQLLLVYNIAFSILATAVISFDSVKINAGTFLFAKIIGFLSAAGLHYYMAKESYFYFRNAGYSMWKIVVSAFVVDMAAYFIIIAVASLITQLCIN